jgi:hypothetical protein
MGDEIIHSCRHCKHWKAPPPRMISWLGTCLLISRDENGYSLQGGTDRMRDAASVSAQELPADLDTKPDFGCVLWAAR